MASAKRYPALTSFLRHSTVAYHTEIDAPAVRSSLLAWYEKNRRRLPWRGDAPPYNGSTAAANVAKNKNSKVKSEAAQPVSAYGVWVSEIMLQQTRVEAVIPYWLAWMEAFPTVEALAAASEEEVNAKWAGLGFYRRARMLHEGSKQVVNDLDGELPSDVAGLLQIKGIGPYTAGAVASITAGVAAPIVDGNVLRVLSRLCAIAAHPKEPSFANDGKLAWRLATTLVEANNGERPGELNQALMELGATHCAPGGTGIDPNDPLIEFYRSTLIGREAYRAHKKGDLLALIEEAEKGLDDGEKKSGIAACPVSGNGARAVLDGLRTIACGACKDEEAAAILLHSMFPLPVPKKARREERLAIAAIYRLGEDGTSSSSSKAKGKGGGSSRSWLLVKRPDGGLLAGQWEFPHEIVASDKESLPDDPGKKVRSAATKAVCSDASFLEEGDEKLSLTPLGETLEHIFSHVRHTMHVEHALYSGGEEAVEPWTGNRGRSYCWMDEKKMKEVGVTAGVLKVIAAVEGATGGASAAAKQKGTKRAAVEDVKQPKLSKFFGKK